MSFINFNIQNNFEGIAVPTTSNDLSQGYDVGSMWFNTVSSQWYICNVATIGAAVWSLFVTNFSYTDTIQNSATESTYVEHFIGSTNGSILPQTNSSTSGGGVISGIAQSGHPGRRLLQTGAGVAVSRCQDTGSAGTSAIWFDDGITQMNVRCKPPIAGVGTDLHEILIGFVGATGFPPTLGIYWHYQPSLYLDNFFRVVFTRGALSYREITTISLGVTTPWREFGVRSNAGIGFAGVRNFQFYYADDSTPYALINTITEAEITAALITLPYGATDDFTPSYGIQKVASSAVQRTLDVDSLTLYKKITG
jgi:hypothetical protein